MIKYILTRTFSTIGDTFVWTYDDLDSVKNAFEIECKNFERWCKDNNVTYTATKSKMNNILTATMPYQHHTDIVTLAYMPINM